MATEDPGKGEFELVFDGDGKFLKAKKGGKPAVEKNFASMTYSAEQLLKFPKVEFIFCTGSTVKCIVHDGRLY